MQLVEQHVIDKNDPRYSVIDEAAFKSKNLYNAALYEIRQAFIHEGKYLNYNEVQRHMQSHEAYKGLPAKVSQQILMVLDRNWKSFFEALEAYNEDPSKFLGRPKLPKYKHKTAGRNILVYTIQAISKKSLKRGLIRLPMLPIEMQTKHKDIDQVRIVPRKGFYVVEAVYGKEVKRAEVNPAYYAGIDQAEGKVTETTRAYGYNEAHGAHDEQTQSANRSLPAYSQQRDCRLVGTRGDKGVVHREK